MSLNSSLRSNSKPNDHLPATLTGYSFAADTNELFEMSEISNCASAKMKIDDHSSLNTSISSADMVDGCLDTSTTSTSSLVVVSNGHPPNLHCDNTSLEGDTAHNGVVQSHPMSNGVVSCDDGAGGDCDRLAPSNHASNGHSSSPLLNGHLANGFIANGDIPLPNSRPLSSSSSPLSTKDANSTAVVEAVDDRVQKTIQPTSSHHQTSHFAANGHSTLSNGSIANSQLDAAPSSKPALANGSCQNHQKTVPFTLLPGEQLRADGALNEGFIYLTNYRLHVEPSCEPEESSPLPPSCNQEQQQELDSPRIISMPIGAIDSIELRDLYFLVVFSKYVQSFVLSFQSTESATLWHKHLSDANNLKVEELFCFQFFKALTQSKNTAAAAFSSSPFGKLVALNQKEVDMYSEPKEMVLQEFKRMNFDAKHWRLCELNSKEPRFCSSYPQYFIVPKEITDKELGSVANFRISHRVPVVVWRSQKNGCVIVRSSQPIVGWLGWRSPQDELLLKKIREICNRDTQECNSGRRERTGSIRARTASSASISTLNGLAALPPYGDLAASRCSSEAEKLQPRLQSIECNGQAAVSATANGHVVSNGSVATNKSMEKLDDDSTSKLLILDARSYPAAFANRAMGGGCECADYYENCDVQFMGLNNIHSIRKSFQSLRYICEASQIEQSNWFTQLDNTKWFHNLSDLLKAALVVVDTISIHERPVLVHCSDGWDRTPQIVALAQLMLDPYYRTIDGFKVLIEREWLQFGHKFADRCRSTTLNINLNERCPVFLQWLDCVHQLIRQFPCEFEFNVYFLIKLVYHTYSNLFGTFVCNNIEERLNEKLYQNTISIWPYMELERNNFTNYLYYQKSEVLRPSYRVKDMVLWSEVYVPVSGTSVASLIPLPDCRQDVCNMRSLFNSVTMKNDMDSTTALNEANIDESGLEVDSTISHSQELQKCKSHSKCDLHRSASCDNMSSCKMANSSSIISGYSNASLSKGVLPSASLQPSEAPDRKLQTRHLSDSCLYNVANDRMVSNDRDSFLGSSVRSHDSDCDKELLLLQGTNKSDGAEATRLIPLEAAEKAREETAANGNVATANGYGTTHLCCFPPSSSTLCGNVADIAPRCHENGVEPCADMLATELLNMVEPMIDIDGQIVVKDKSYLQLQQLIIRYKREIASLTRDLKSAQKIICSLRSQSAKQSEDSRSARNHSTLNGDHCVRHMNALDPTSCDNRASPCVTNRPSSSRDITCRNTLNGGKLSKNHKSSSHRPRSMTEGKTTNHFAD